MSYLSNTGTFNGNTMATVSAMYPTLFTPAPYAFTIWIVIYLSLLGYVFYQGRSLWGHEEATIAVQQVGWWFVLSCVANCAWVLAWLYDQTGLSVLIMLFLLFCLLRIIWRTNMELTDPPLSTVAGLWWPFCFYFGWIMAALLANISAWLTKIGGADLSPVAIAIIMIVLAGVAYLFMTWRRNMREAAFVGVWALIAIAIADVHRSPTVTRFAVGMSAVLFVSSSIHGYMNRSFSPWRKRP